MDLRRSRRGSVRCLEQQHDGDQSRCGLTRVAIVGSRPRVDGTGLPSCEVDGPATKRRLDIPN